MEGANDNLRKELLAKLYQYGGHSQVVGITGPPGIGKSTLIGNMSSLIIKSGKKVAILAIDASSPYTGGSFLGNRIRMQDQLWENKIYMRSLANRGSKGGLADSALGSVIILDAAGYDYIIIETVGSGQADLDIMNLADTTVLVLAPGLGDQIQAIKAGIMEIADIFVMNKMDREGAYFAMKDIEDTLSLDENKEFRREVIGSTITKSESYLELINAIGRHREFLDRAGQMGKKRLDFALRWVLEDELKEKLIDPIIAKIHSNPKNASLKENIYQEVDFIIDSLDIRGLLKKI